MKILKTIFYFLMAIFFISACDTNPNSEPEQELLLKSESLSPEDRLALLPNSLFVAVIDSREADELKNLIDANGEYLLESNEAGDTPLGLAIEFNEEDLALFLAKQLDPTNYLHQNHKGESYLYLASKKGMVELIQFLSIQFWTWNQDLFQNHEFDKLDLQTKEGEKALHVAKNSAVADTLSTEYRRGSLEYPYREFVFYENHLGQNFLHTAVRDQNEDLLRWGLKKVCSSHENLSFTRSALVYTWEAIQKFGKPLSLDWDNLLNTQDAEGLTALNFAAKSQNLPAMEILSTCPWNNYRLGDNEGNIPLQNFLLSLDPLKSGQDEKIKASFVKLMHSETLLSLSGGGIAQTIDIHNKKGDTSLHIAARLNDTFFYEELKQYGHIEHKNEDGQTPREIFVAKRRQLSERI